MADFGVLTQIRYQVSLNKECERLTRVLQETIKAMVLTMEVCPKLKHWWTKEIRELRVKYRKLGRKVGRYKDQPEHRIHAEHKEAHRQYNKAIKYNKRHHWLEKASEPDLWTANKFLAVLASDGGKTRIPMLRQQVNGREKMANSNQDKSKMLVETFFPSKPINTINIYEYNKYPTPACKTHQISREKIRRQLKWLKPYKAPRPDGIPNIVLTQCADLITDILWYIYNVILEKEFYYTLWKTFTTVVLRKLGKPHYDTPKVYHTIALLNTLGKLMTVAIAEQLTFYTEKHMLLPSTHFRGDFLFQQPPPCRCVMAHHWQWKLEYSYTFITTHN